MFRYQLVFLSEDNGNLMRVTARCCVIRSDFLRQSALHQQRQGLVDTVPRDVVVHCLDLIGNCLRCDWLRFLRTQLAVRETSLGSNLHKEGIADLRPPYSCRFSNRQIMKTSANSRKKLIPMRAIGDTPSYHSVGCRDQLTW